MEVIPSGGFLPRSEPVALGDNGWVLTQDGIYHNGILRSAGQIGGSNVSLTSINGSGVGVGYYKSGYLPRYGDTYSAAMWSGGTSSDLGASGQSTSANYIANDGTILGTTFSYDTRVTYARAWVLQNGQYTTLAHRTSNAYSSTRASAVNARGVVVGAIDGPDGNYYFHAARWVDNVYQDLGTGNSSYRQSAATGISDDGDILMTGFRDYYSSGDDYSSFVWSGGLMTPLPTFGGSRSQAFSMNAQGKVVGMSEDTAGSFRPFLWDKANGLVSLDHLLAGTEYYGFRPSQVNAQGQILGVAFRQDSDGGTNPWAVLFTPEPVPEPAVLATLGVGFLAMLRRRRRSDRSCVIKSV